MKILVWWVRIQAHPQIYPNIIGKMVGKPLGDGGPLIINPKKTPFLVGIYWVYPLGGEIHQVLVDFAGQGMKET